MRANPILPDDMTPEVRLVHDGVVELITRSQGPLSMINEQGALTGPFPPMFQFPQFGMPALGFIRSMDAHATLPKKMKEVAILTVGSALGCQFELYAHKIMAAHFGFSNKDIEALAEGIRPQGLNAEESIAYDIANILAKGSVIPDALYNYALKMLGTEATAELIFLISAYAMLAMVLNGFDVQPNIT